MPFRKMDSYFLMQDKYIEIYVGATLWLDKLESSFIYDNQMIYCPWPFRKIFEQYFHDYFSFSSGVAVAIMLISVSPFQEPSLMQEIVGKAGSGQRKLNLL